MDRREFLTVKPKPRSKQQGTGKYRVLSGIEPYTGPWGTAEVVHLIKRTKFGISKSYINHYKEKSLSESVEELLNPTDAFSSPVKDYVGLYGELNREGLKIL